MTPTTYGRDFAYCLKSHGGVRGFNASLWRFLLRCTLFCHSVATFLTSVSSYEGGCGFEANLIETDEMWNRRKELTKDARFESKSKALTLHNGEIIHISNQFNVNRIENFINCVNAQNWNIRIEKL